MERGREGEGARVSKRPSQLCTVDAPRRNSVACVCTDCCNSNTPPLTPPTPSTHTRKRHTHSKKNATLYHIPPSTTPSAPALPQPPHHKGDFPTVTHDHDFADGLREQPHETTDPSSPPRHFTISARHPSTPAHLLEHQEHHRREQLVRPVALLLLLLREEVEDARAVPHQPPPVGRATGHVPHRSVVRVLSWQPASATAEATPSNKKTLTPQEIASS